jgi:hypothetical protein
MDPVHELRILAVQYSATVRAEVVPGTVPFHRRLARSASAVTEQPPVRQALAVTGLTDTFPGAVTAVLEEEATRQAMRHAVERTHAGELRGALARAFVAEAAVRYEADRGWPPMMSGRHRDALVAAVQDALGERELGLSERLLGFSGRMAMRMGGARALENRRHSLFLAHHPMAGDVLRYLSRGEQIQDFIRRTLRGISGDVVLLAHSLGGIACLDLLISEEFPSVRALVTVGSQAPLLYELGALPSLGYGAPLPSSVPRWINVYDPRDLLAYVGSDPRLFGDRVEDVAVDNGCPFPDAHSAYFDHPDLYRVVDRCLS